MVREREGKKEGWKGNKREKKRMRDEGERERGKMSDTIPCNTA